MATPFMDAAVAEAWKEVLRLADEVKSAQEAVRVQRLPGR